MTFMFGMVVGAGMGASIAFLIANRSRKGLERLSASQEATINMLREQFERQSQTLAGLESDRTKLRDALARREEQLAVSGNLEQILTRSQEVLGQLFKEAAQNTQMQLSATGGSVFRNEANSLREQIVQFQGRWDQLSKSEAESRQRELTEIRTRLLDFQKTNLDLAAQTAQLTDCLTSTRPGASKSRGILGEEILQRLLEGGGLVQEVHFRRQCGGTVQSSDGHDQTVIADFIVHMPDGRHLVIDSKCSFKPAFELRSATTEEAQEKSLKALVTSLRQHLDGLGDHHYQTMPGLQSPDFVIMFIPYPLILNLLPPSDVEELLMRGLKKKVLIADPLNLLYVIKIVSELWDRDSSDKNRQEIVRLGGAIYDKLANFLEKLEALGKGLETASRHFQEARTTLTDGKGNLVSLAVKLKEFGVKPKKCLPADLVEKSSFGFALPFCGD